MNSIKQTFCRVLAWLPTEQARHCTTAHSAYCCESWRCSEDVGPFISVYCIYQSCGHVSARVRHPSSRGNTPLSSAIYCPDPLHKMKYLTHSPGSRHLLPAARLDRGVKMLNLPQFSRCYHQQATHSPSGAVQYSTVQYSTINRQHNHPRVLRLLTHTRIETHRLRHLALPSTNYSRYK